MLTMALSVFGHSDLVMDLLHTSGKVAGREDAAARAGPQGVG